MERRPVRPAQTEKRGTDLSAAVPVVRRWWWLLGIGAGVAALMGFLVVARLPTTYEAEARILVGPLSGDQDTLDASGALAQTYAALATSGPVVDRIATSLGVTPETVESKIYDVTASDTTRLLTIRARDTDRFRAVQIANETAFQLLQEARREGGLTSPEGRLRIVERATLPADTTGPSPALIVPAAALLGLLAAFGLAFLVDSLSTVVRNEEELAGLAPVAVLGSVNGTRFRRSKQIVGDAGSDSKDAGAYRLLVAKIQLADGNQAIRSLLVIDSHRGHSSGMLAANVAGALADGGTRVVLVDTEGKGEVSTLFGLDEEEALKAESGPVRRARPLRVDRLSLDRFRVRQPRLTIVRPRALPDSLEPEWASDVLGHLLAEADLAVLAAPSLDRSPGGLAWSRVADATVLVVERDHTKREQVPSAVESLRGAGAKIVGTVLFSDRLF